MNSLVILLISIVVLVCGYLFYGRWLAKEWGVDPSRETPAHTMADGLDYCPAKAPVLLGHHFASIAGAGPINGPIAAAAFGWLPVLLWVLIGGIFFGGMHDFAALFSSVRHEGRSIGHVIDVNIGHRAKKLFLVFAYVTLLLVVAAFGAVVAGTFDGFNPDGTQNIANGRTVSISILFIILAILFGFLVYRRNAPLGVSTVIGVVALIVCIAIGYNFPIYMDIGFWRIMIMIYILIASVTPVWILLQPRDYLNSFLLYGMMILALLGILVAHPNLNLPATFGFKGLNGQPMFPILFITVACGAISGFHSLVGSGTTSKQLDNEKDAMKIGYGAMLVESALAVVALIAAGILFKDGALSKLGPTAVFASGIASMLQSVFGEASYELMYSCLILAVSAFCLTSLDTATRLARYMFQEFFLQEGQDPSTLTGYKKFFANPYVATIITIAIGGSMMSGGFKTIWPLFGAANQLLAALALLAGASWLGNIGKNNKMFFIPMIFMLIATLSALIITIRGKFNLVGAGEATTPDWMQLVFAIVLVVLAIILAVEALGHIFGSKKAEAK